MGIGFGAERDHRTGLLGRWIDNVEVVGYRRIDPRAVDVELATIERCV